MKIILDNSSETICDDGNIDLNPNKDGTFPKRQVVKEDMKTIITYDGKNGDAMVGFYLPLNASNRDGFTDRSYCAPVGKAQIDQYAEKGYKLTQTTLW